MAHPLSSGTSDLPRRIAAGALFVGGALAFIATFLPLVYLTYPDTHGRIDADPEIPAQAFISFLQFYRQDSYLQTPTIVAMCVWAFLLWGVPLILAIFGLALFVARRWTPGWRLWTVGLILVLLGVGYTVVSCLFFVNLQGAVVQVITYGTGLTLFGYLIALAGVTWLVLPRPRRARVKRRLPEM
jgi:hypothetical protein